MTSAPLSSKGLTLAIATFTFWGLLPIYWHELQHVHFVELVSHRILGGVVLMLALILWGRRWHILRPHLTNLHSLAFLLITGLLLLINWFVFIWAVLNNHILEASLGYFLMPLVALALGITFFNERLNRWQSLSFLLAGVGVALHMSQAQALPWISLTLALSFGIYGALRKLIPTDATSGIFIEMLLTAPIALALLLWLEFSQGGLLLRLDLRTDILLLFAGAATVAPIMLYALSIELLPLFVIGLVSYINPFLQFVCGLAFGEELQLVEALGFVAIWIGLAVFMADQYGRARSRRGGAPAKLERALP